MRHIRPTTDGDVVLMDINKIEPPVLNPFSSMIFPAN